MPSKADYYCGQGFAIERARFIGRYVELDVREAVTIKLVRFSNARETVSRVYPSVSPSGRGWMITLHTYLDPFEASRSVYHELAHILQSQRLGGWDKFVERQEQELIQARLIGPNQFPASTPMRVQQDATERMPFEQEADRMMDIWHEELPLAVRLWY